MASYDLSKKATEDLYNVWNYTYETWSEVQADRYYTILVNAFSVIASGPDAIGQSFDEILDDLRSYHVRKHMIFYTMQGNGRILIVRILHEKMDFKRHF